MPKKIVIYLASQSPRRRHLLRRAGYRCHVIPSSYIEKHEPQAVPKTLVLKHARGKLTCAQIPSKARFVMSADTVVAFQGRIYGKPGNLKKAERMLQTLSGNVHDVYTGWAMLDVRSGKKVTRCIRSKVKIRHLSKSEINSYFKKMNPLDKAGSYAVQSRPSIVESIKGSYSNVMGLPMEDFEIHLKRFLESQ